MKKLYSLVLLFTTLSILSCSKDKDDEILISNQEMVIGHWRLQEVVFTNAYGVSTTEDATNLMFHQYIFQSEGKLTSNLQALHEDQTPDGEIETTENAYSISADGKQITITSNRVSQTGDILRLGKTDFQYKMIIGTNATAEYHLKRIN